MESNAILNFLQNDTIIVFDTNIWLDIYRVLPDEIANTLSLLSKRDIKEKMYIPSFVSYEFKKHHRQLQNEHSQIVERANSKLKDTVFKFKTKTFEDIVSLRDRHGINTIDVEKKFAEKFADLEKIAADFLEYNDTQILLEDDDIKLRIKSFFDELYKTNSIDCLSKNEILELITEGEQRYQNKTPPGYKDKIKDEKGRFIYGDLIIWKEIMKYARIKSKNVLFVTNDVKEDWFDTLGFNQKLVDEFELVTEHKIMGLKGREFYDFARKQYLTASETLTDIDTYIDQHYKKLLNSIQDELLAKVNDELYYSYGGKNRVYDPWEVLSLYDGEYYELVDISTFALKNATFERYGSIVEVTAAFDLEFTVQTAGYEGRDDDTHEVYLSPTRKHTLGGVLEITLQKSATEFILDLSNYDIIDMQGTIDENNYDDGYGED